MEKITRVLWFATALIHLVLGSAALIGYFGTKSENTGLSLLIPQELPLIGYYPKETNGKTAFSKMDREAFNASVRAVQRRDYLEAMIFAYDKRERDLSEEINALLLWMLILGSCCVIIGVLSLGFTLPNRQRRDRAAAIPPSEAPAPPAL